MSAEAVLCVGVRPTKALLWGLGSALQRRVGGGGGSMLRHSGQFVCPLAHHLEQSPGPILETLLLHSTPVISAAASAGVRPRRLLCDPVSQQQPRSMVWLGDAPPPPRPYQGPREMGVSPKREQNQNAPKHLKKHTHRETTLKNRERD